MVEKPAVNEGSHDETLVAVRDSMLDGLGQLSDYFGFSKTMGQLYGALLLSDRPLCLDDFVERLDISKANASINMRTLENLGIARQVWVRGAGGRRKYYEAETDFLQIISNVLASRELRDVERALSVMQENSRRLQESMPSMSDEDRQLAEVYQDRIHRMESLFRLAQLVIASVLAQVGEADLEAISRIDIG
jgi:DNA-binding transcriptional regulator GbsR (MarR family)